jgi:hypothetical protein
LTGPRPTPSLEDVAEPDEDEVDDADIDDADLEQEMPDAAIGQVVDDRRDSAVEPA